ncbi:MAG: glycosyltransferase family 2 protein [Lachnospiraceae bacterium]
MDATIVIPTKNGGDLFEKVLERIFHQKTQYEYEVICVDSGSLDGTIETIKKYPCKLYQIPKEEFGHGKTRNYGAAKGTGEFIVFITQDAMPASDTWLQSFIDGMKTDDKIAGGFGIHYPYPDCNLIDKIMLRNHFRNFGDKLTVFQIEDKKRYETDDGYRGFISFFSDNNSCLRRSVWEQYPYEDVNFAEDQIWAKKVMELGYKKVYVPDAPVYHSHNFPLKSYLGRCYDEFKALYELNGYTIAQTPWQVVNGSLHGFVYDARCIRGEAISKAAKIKWAVYALFRNYYKYLGAYFSVKYFQCDSKKQLKMDKKYSQQYRQRRM